MVLLVVPESILVEFVVRGGIGFEKMKNSSFNISSWRIHVSKGENIFKDPSD